MSPSPPTKMASKDKSMPFGDEDPELDLAKLESISDMDTDTVSLHSKMDTMIGLMRKMMKCMDSHQKTSTKEFQDLKEENQCLKLKVAEADGKMIRMAKKINDLQDKCENLQLRSMNKNVLIYNIKEHQGEDIYQVVHDVLTTKLKLPEELIHSEKNPVAPVQVDVAHRIGKPSARDRPIVVQLALRRGKEIIFSYAKNLRDTSISISEQLPSQMRERREAQLGHFKKLREEHRHHENVHVRLTRDKLLVNSKPVKNCFESNTLQDAHNPPINPIKFEDMVHTKIFEQSQSYFQGHVYTVNTVAEASAAWSALLQDPEVAKAHHISYAYSISDETGETSGQSDDGETGASELIKTVIEDKKLTNVFLAVSRLHNGPNLGKKRFEIIRATALDALVN